MVEISVGKERYGFSKSKVKYWIQIDNVTDYYYSEYTFWKEFFRVCELYEVSELDKTILGFSIK